MSLKERIDILEQSGVIGPETAKYMYWVIDHLAEWMPDMPADKAEMFTTHLAMALDRIAKGEVEEPLDDDAWQQIRECEAYDEAEEFLAHLLENAPVEVPDSEKQYLLLHVCNIMTD